MGNRIASTLPRLAGPAVLGAAIAVPVVVAAPLADPAVLPKATLLWIGAVVAGLGLAADRLARGRAAWPPRPQALVPVAVLVGWTAVAVAFDDTPVGSIIGARGRYDGLASLLACAVLAAAVVVTTWWRPERLASLAVAIGIAGAIGAGWVLLEQAGLRPVGWQLRGEGGRVIGVAGNPNFSGAHLAMVVPLVLAGRRSTASRPARRGLAALAVALVVGVVVTRTAGGVLALAGGVVVAVLLDRDLLPRPARVAVLVAAGLLVGGSALALVVDDLPDRLPFGSSLIEATGFEQRANIWASAGSMVVEHPLVGVGPDDFGEEVATHRSSRGEDLLISADEAHDVPLDRAATAGVPAMLAHVWLLGVVGVATWRARRRVADAHRWLLAGFGGLTGAYVLQSLVSIDAPGLALTGWLGLGALVALADPALVQARAAGATRRPVPREVPWPLAVGAVALSAGLVVVAIRPAIADRAHHRALVARAHDRPLEALRHDRTAASWVGEEPAYRTAMADDLVAFAGRPSTDPALRRTLLDEALVAYDQAAERAPADVGIDVAHAQVEVLAALAAADPTVARRHLDAGAATYRELLGRLAATDDLHLPYGRLLLAEASLGSPEGAAEVLRAAALQFELATGYRSHRSAARLELARVRLAQGRPDDARSLLDELRASDRSPEVAAAVDELERQLDDGGG
ncbi:MAG: O-antigen ligase family protein [Acidimicrobiales bacterium]|nr:O-antigen ligase family protein [Acidimicrobiales bacterium]